MWKSIAKKLNSTFKLNLTSQQVENRVKTVLKREKKDDDHNSETGSKRNRVEFKEELRKIANKMTALNLK